MDRALAELIARLRAADAATLGAETRLCVYGTLAPGEPNHHHVAHLGGTWTAVRVTGRRAERHYPVFTFDPDAPPVPMQLLESAALPGAWAALDRFEGPGYRRILVPALRAGAPPVAAFVYEAVRPVDADGGS